MNKNPRNELNLQSPKERVKNFDEVSLGFDEAKMLDEASRCLNCKSAPCKLGCPVQVDIPAFIERLHVNDLNGAENVLKSANNLPAICGRVCPQETQCEKLCIRKEKLGGSVAIGALERYVGDYSLKHSSERVEKKPSIGKKVAVIGSGPAGLTCAADCAKAGFDVTVFEAFHKAGGVLTYGIPEFRLPKEHVVQREIDALSALGVKMKFNAVVGKTFSLNELRRDFDAIFIGTGAGLPIFAGIKGENLNGVSSANEYLTRVNLMGAYKPNSVTPVYTGNSVVVVGAGNVAMDAARTAKRMGAERVYIMYRRGREEMPARAEEIEHAVEEGVELMLLTAPIEILGNVGRVEGVRATKMELGAPDASGRRSPIKLQDGEFELECDQVIMALGTSPNPLISMSESGLKTSSKGTVIVDEVGMTSIESVYAGGDAVTGAATVILAMGAGKKAAKSIIERLT